jgi:hypothetical protein
VDSMSRARQVDGVADAATASRQSGESFRYGREWAMFAARR